VLVNPQAWKSPPTLCHSDLPVGSVQESTSSARPCAPETTLDHRGQRPYRRTKRLGATALEFAIVAPVFFLFVLGIFEIGRGIMVRHLLTNAARRGCRLGIIEGTSTAQINTVTAAALASTGINGDTVTVLVNNGSSDAANAVAGDQIAVFVSVPAQNVSWVPKLQFLSGSISGQYTMRRE
jgi:Flp pilus assembly protein TadG